MMGTVEAAWQTSQSLVAELLAAVARPFVLKFQSLQKGAPLLQIDPNMFDKSFVGSSTKAADPMEDVCVYLMFAVMFLVMLLIIRHCVIEPLARILLKSSDPAKRIKFGDSGSELVSYFVFTVIGMSVCLTQMWVWPSSQWWEGRGEGQHAEMRNDLRCWYIMDASRYTAALVSLIFFEHKRRDSTEMFVHHVAAILVTFVSYQYDWTRVGAVVKLLMDPADVPLHTAKIFKYVGEGRGKISVFTFLADRSFEFFAVTFFITRLVMFGYVVWACAHAELGTSGYICTGLLVVLYCLQVFWFILIAKMAVKMVKGDKLEDIRSDSDDDDDDDDDSGASTKRKRTKKAN
jgi:ceramide synthetase